jgi:glycosyltransferase involved in cell wall biosynthesis
MPTVSVIMPAYNVAPYIGDAIASALAQTVTDFELLVVDDGSTDDTARIAAAWAARDPRIRVLRKANGGISSARNHALAHAAGAFIAILDSDDLWEPNYLASQLATLDARPEVDLVTGNARYLGSWLDGQLVRPSPDPRPEPDLAQILTDANAVFIMTVFHRRVYDTIGGFDEALRTNEDYDYWLRAAIAGFRFARNDRPLGRYRRRDDSLSASEVRMLQGALRVNRKMHGLLAERPADLALLESQTAWFEAELVAAEARAALEAACLVARWTPGLLARAYHLRRARLEAHA